MRIIAAKPVLFRFFHSFDAPGIPAEDESRAESPSQYNNETAQEEVLFLFASFS
jgi:hypothetical protein